MNISNRSSFVVEKNSINNLLFLQILSDTKIKIYASFVLLTFIFLVYIWYNSTIQSNDDCISETFAKVNPWLGTVDNSNVAPEDDCALRVFTIEMAAYIAPAAWKTNWTTLSQSAFQMNQCNSISYRA